MGRLSAAAFMSAMFATASVAADNSSCWDDPKRTEISCTPLTQKLLLSLQFASRQHVVEVMKAEGRRLSADNPNVLHFIGNASRGGSGTGVLNVTFRDDKVVVIQAFVDRPQRHLEYIWNAELGACSDFPGSPEKCNE